MSSEFLSPIEDSVLAHSVLFSQDTLGSNILINSTSNGFPNLEGVQLALVGVEEDRNAEDNSGIGQELHNIRRHFYLLYPGDWNSTFADLGNIKKGNSTSDTHFAVRQVIEDLLKLNIIPIILGGGQDITYSNYRAYDNLDQTVNLVCVDSMFDLGDLEDELSSRSYLTKIIMQEPNNLFNYSNIGYQTYLNSQEQKKLIHSLNFDAYRLGVAKKTENVEPVVRGADIISIDIGSVRQSDAPANNNVSPNGFYGEEICAIARYAGLSDKVSSFGIYEYNAKYDHNYQTAHLIAEMIWYFIEGFNLRAKDYPYCTKESYQKFSVLLEDDDMINFYKSDKSGRWWMEINIIDNNKYKSHSLIPCTYQDYVEATQQKIPERWYKAQLKMIQ